MSSMGTVIVVVLLLGGWRMFTDASTHEHLRCGADITTDDEFIANKNMMLEAMHVSTAGIVLDDHFGSIDQTDSRFRTISYGPVQQYLGNRSNVVMLFKLGLYGKSWCDLSYTDKECVDCLGTAVDAVMEGCGNALQVEYNGTYCGVRYADYPF